MTKNLLLSASLALSVATFLTVCDRCYGANLSQSQSQEAGKDILTELIDQLEPVIKKHFPRAAVKKTDNSIHFEFKAQKFATTDGSQLLLPKSDGIVCEIELKPGKHRGKHVMPLTTNETLYYSIAWWPYSHSKNAHLYIKLLCPHDMNIGVSDEFKEVINSFCQSPEFVVEEKPIAPTEMLAITSASKRPEPVPSQTHEENPPEAKAASPPAEQSSTDSERQHKEDFVDFGSNGILSAVKDAVSDPASVAKQVKPLPRAASVQPPKAPPKPTKEYFKAWFKKFYATMERAHYVPEVENYFTSAFGRQYLAGVGSLPPVMGNRAFKILRMQCYLSGWTIDKIQPGPGGCTDLVVTGLTYDQHPGYVVYRMVLEGGAWRIDSGRIRLWTSNPNLYLPFK